MKEEIPYNCLDCDLFRDKEGLSCTHWHSNDIIIGDPRIVQVSCPLKTEVLDCKRHIVMYRGEKFYVVVAELDEMPWEIFSELSHTEHKDDLPYMIGGWTLTTRMVTLALKAYPLKRVVKQCYRSSYIKGDIPSIIGDLLKTYLEK